LVSFDGVSGDRAKTLEHALPLIDANDEVPGGLRVLKADLIIKDVRLLTRVVEIDERSESIPPPTVLAGDVKLWSAAVPALLTAEEPKPDLSPTVLRRTANAPDQL
jgi:hypothetical protein